MNEQKSVKGYKVFNPDWTCRGFQYTCPGIFEEDVIPSVCDRGFHFCLKAADCFNYYGFDPDNKVAEVIALGDVSTDRDKSCTNKIQIVREIPWSELLEIINTGKSCSGLCNSGDCNSGDWNKTNFSNGCFNTVEPKIFLFNKPSDWTFRQWRESIACDLLSRIPYPGSMLEYIWLSNMTDEEKAAHPEAQTTGGYLKVLERRESNQVWWDRLCDNEKDAIMQLPNFDKDIFQEITEIKI